jgi:hypothetical protein
MPSFGAIRDQQRPTKEGGYGDDGGYATVGVCLDGYLVPLRQGERDKRKGVSM